MAQTPTFELEFVTNQPGINIGAAAGDPIPKGKVQNPGGPPHVILRDTQAWEVIFRWRTSGSNVNVVSGAWTCTVNLLGLNGAADRQFSVPGVGFGVNDPTDYNVPVPIPAGIPVGLYKLYADVNLEVVGAANAKITGFGEGPMVEIYTPN